MKTTILALVLACATPALAQQMDLPKLSPGAKVSQTIGLTDVTVDYSSPGVRGRKIWGGVVQYGQVWRTGANAATKITFSKDVSISGTAIPAGTYALFAIPNKATWTVILNKEANQGGAFNYKKDLDIARLEVKPQTIANRERLAYIFSDFNNDQGTLDLEWEKIRVAIPIKVNTDKQVAATIKGLTENGQMPYTQAARYMLEQSKDYDSGLKLVDHAITMKEDWLSDWTKAQLLAAKGDYKEALPLAQKAQDLGQKSERFFYSDDVKKALGEWKGK